MLSQKDRILQRHMILSEDAAKESGRRCDQTFRSRAMRGTMQIKGLQDGCSKLSALHLGFLGFLRKVNLTLKIYSKRAAYTARDFPLLTVWGLCEYMRTGESPVTVLTVQTLWSFGGAQGSTLGGRLELPCSWLGGAPAETWDVIIPCL